MTDTHIHLHHPIFQDNLDQLLAEASAAGVTRFISASVDLPSWELNKSIQKRFPQVMIGFGIHPWYCDNLSADFITEDLSHDVLKHASIISEIGLDKDCGVSLKQQEIIFRTQLVFAEQHNLAVVLHCRSSWERIFSHLADFKLRGIVHNFTGSYQTALQLRKHGFYLSFSGVITRPGIKRAITALANLSLEDIVLETDAPDLSPAGTEPPNKPCNIVKTAQFVADLMNVDLPLLYAQTEKNIETLITPQRTEGTNE